ncbi:hypothetical protein AU476_01375 [Cupriavidus sp. UYMSc13B]|nr:hypothetical protein AU476_01375 [Cupriavidus sp. UYMSc13B]
MLAPDRLQALLNLILPALAVWAEVPLLKGLWNRNDANWMAEASYKLFAVGLVCFTVVCAFGLAVVIRRWTFRSESKAH